MERIVKKIQLLIPENDYLPDDLYTLTPEETLWLLKMGYNIIISAKNNVNSLTNDEIRSEINKTYQSNKY